ncbi:MAG TPA: hypothetical protein PKJ21_07895 [Anaerolineae bacterium]|nr:hypothetical protein [Anaerolineae bacterium]HNT06081.1 hypothetical protein [Anaerolineae bacterium]HOU23281.1 hypothetical protein [Anaerolineae bacterium]HQJ51887.1 hypothetical protein [Anaerolineae bacterium]
MSKIVTFVLGIVSGAAVTLLTLVVVLAIILSRPVAATPVRAEASTSDVVVAIDEKYLSRVATEAMHQQQEAVQSVAVDVLPQAQLSIVITTRFEVIGIELHPSLKLVGFVQVADNLVGFSLQKIELAGISIPRSSLPGPLLGTVQALEVTLSKSINQALADTRLAPTTVSSTESTLDMFLQFK